MNIHTQNADYKYLRVLLNWHQIKWRFCNLSHLSIHVCIPRTLTGNCIEQLWQSPRAINAIWHLFLSNQDDHTRVVLQSSDTLLSGPFPQIFCSISIPSHAEKIVPLFVRFSSFQAKHDVTRKCLSSIALKLKHLYSKNIYPLRKKENFLPKTTHT